MLLVRSIDAAWSRATKRTRVRARSLESTCAIALREKRPSACAISTQNEATIKFPRFARTHTCSIAVPSVRSTNVTFLANTTNRTPSNIVSTNEKRIWNPGNRSDNCTTIVAVAAVTRTTNVFPEDQRLRKLAYVRCNRVSNCYPASCAYRLQRAEYFQKRSYCAEKNCKAKEYVL